MFVRACCITLLVCWLTAPVSVLADEESKPHWIWLNEANGRPADRVHFRHEFQVRKDVAAARLYATCDNRMTVYLDGEPVLSSDQWQTPAYADLSEQINQPTKRGQHVLTIEAENDPGSPAGLLVQFNFDTAWRKAWSEVSDTSWKASTKAAKGWRKLKFDDSAWTTAESVGRLGDGPWTQINTQSLAAASRLREPTATPINALTVADGFNVELLYSVPKDQQGSWVSMCVAPKGQLIVSDQYGGLFRVTPPAMESNKAAQIEEIDVDIGEAQGLLWAFDRLYVMVNRGEKYDSGLYQVTDTDGDDQLDTVETLQKLKGGGEHGPHAVLPTPDGNGLYVVCGDGTKLPELDSSRVPRVWDEDLLLPRPYGRGFMKGTPAPGGFICRIDPDGEHWELVATGFRNQYDAALNADGELFTYDADMEWDMNTPWYRPTRIYQATSGVDFGWRNGGGKWPATYPSTLPPVVDIGPGSPTGVSFGCGAAFPAKYQRALYAADWSYGKLYAVHLQPDGASYTAQFEEFISGTPLPLTDLVVNPHDGAMYFAIGGRRVQSGLYRVTYIGDQSTAPAELHNEAGAEARELRRELERRHVGEHPGAIEFAWPHLASSDRFVRYAARVAIEHRPLDQWRERAFAETDPQASLTALLALVRQYERPGRNGGGRQNTLDPAPPAGGTGEPYSPEAAETQRRVLSALGRLDWDQLDRLQRVAILRVHSLAFLRLGPPDGETRRKLLDRFANRLPTGEPAVDSELAQLLVYLQAPAAAKKIVELLENAPTQELQIDYAKTLRHLQAGWTPELRRRYFRWFNRAARYRGGASFELFVTHIKKEALAQLDESQRETIAEVLEAAPKDTTPSAPEQQREFVREWTMEDLVPLVTGGLKGRDFQRGRQLFAAANCFACHRFDGVGGAVGPDLTGLSGRFSPRDILESIVEPSKEISDQYAAVTVLTLDGRIVTGRIVNLAGSGLRINTDMLDPNKQVGIDRKQIEEMVPAKTSMMPSGLLNTLDEEEVLDLMAYLLSQGDPNHPMFEHGTDAGEKVAD